MQFLKYAEAKGLSPLKLIGIVLFGLIVAAIVLSVLSVSLNTTRYKGGYGLEDSVSSIPMMESQSIDGYAPNLSARNLLMPTQPGMPYATGDDSEAFEVKEYSALIETTDLAQDCDAIRQLKSRNDVIFERADAYTQSCSFSFKVKRDSVEEILSYLKELGPRELSETSYTIKQEITDYTSEIQILENKLTSYDKTLADAIASYGDLTSLATKTGNADALAKIIESKIGIIERLTELRITTVAELDRMNRAKAEALDRLEYTYFNVNVRENKYVDGVALKDSWKAAVKEFVYATNRLIQELSIGVVSFLLMLIKFALYFIIIVIAVRIGWTYVRRLWEVPSRKVE